MAVKRSPHKRPYICQMVNKLIFCRYGAKIHATLRRVKPDGYGELHGAYSVLKREDQGVGVKRVPLFR